jgi:hypothetical protein
MAESAKCQVPSPLAGELPLAGNRCEIAYREQRHNRTRVSKFAHIAKL